MNAPSQKAVWSGRIMSGLVVAFVVGGSAMPKFFLPAIAAEAMLRLGWPSTELLTIALVELGGAVLYALPRTAPLGAVVLTGLFGGAVATHLRIRDPLFSHTLFPVWLGLLMWGGLWLRDARVRSAFSLVGSRGERP